MIAGYAPPSALLRGPLGLAIGARGAFVLALVAAVTGAAPAHADDTPGGSLRVLVDRVDHEPASIGGTRLRIAFSALTLQGGVVDVSDPAAFKVFAGATELAAPRSVGRFGDSGQPLAIVLVIQQTSEFAEVLPVIAESLDQELVLPDHVQLAVLGYGDAPGSGKLLAGKASRARLSQLASDGSIEDPALLDTIDAALRMLRRARSPDGQDRMRKMIVVVGDGRDRARDPDRVSRTGERAAKDGVRIHALAHSPAEKRRSLLLLGELARRSLGTFRWVQRGKADSWGPAAAQLREEILGQYVITLFLGEDVEVAGKKLRVETVGRAVTSSAERQPDLKIPAAACGVDPCAGYCVAARCYIPRASSGRGVLGWIVIVGGIALGVLVLLGLIGYALSKRAPSVPLPPGVTAEMISGMRAAPGTLPGTGPAPVPQVQATGPGLPYVAAPAVAARPIPHLMFLSGPRAGERVALRHGFSIGKAPGCDLLIEDGYTSSHHAQIGIDAAGNCRIYDRGSTNGTFVHGARVTDAPLDHGCTVRIGSTDLRFLAQ